MATNNPRDFQAELRVLGRKLRNAPPLETPQIAARVAQVVRERRAYATMEAHRHDQNTQQAAKEAKA